MAYHLYLSTGETSGEQHAARLAEAIQAARPGTRLSGMGGEALAAAGVETVVDSRRIRVMGYVEVLTHLPAIRKAFRQAVAHVRATRPDAVVLVDYPGFHLALARTLKRHCPEIPILYYILPKVWAWKRYRVKQIRAAVDRCYCILPFEPDWFARHGVAAEYVGNPVVDAVRPHWPGPDCPGPAERSAALRAEVGLGAGERLVALFPGSRRKEVRAILPPLMAAAAHLRARFPELRFAIAAAPGLERELFSMVAPGSAEIPILWGRNLELMAAADYALAKSGTTTLEAALLDCPMVVVYRAHWLTAWIARTFVKIDFFSLPNLIAGREIVPELFQERVNGAEIARVAGLVLGDPEAEARMRADLAALRAHLGEAPTAGRAAAAMLRYLDERRPA